MNTIIINKHEYILCDELFEKAPIYCKGCRSGRELIKKRNINDFIFCKLVENKWIQAEGKSIKFDKVFLRKTFVKSIPEFNQEKNIVDDNNIQLAPDIIYLEDSEKFKDENNNKIDIETRGDRKVEGIYFKVKDVMVGFKMENFDKNIHDKKSYFKENEHYKYFNCNKQINKTSKIKKELYLTYTGLLRILFASHSPNVKPFIKWATETLFTLQLGTLQQKDTLVSKIKGVSYETIQELFSINARNLPCVYLTAFNTVDKLREVMNIDIKFNDNDVVYKFGLTKSFETRKNGHKSEYKKIEHLIDMKLVYYTLIDPLFVSEAENEIKNLLSDYKIDYDNHDELIVIPNSLLKIIKKIYENIGMKFSGHTIELNKQIDDFKNEINKIVLEQKHQIQAKDNEIKHLKLENQIIIQQKDFELELQKEKYEHTILKKDFEILKLQTSHYHISLK